MSESVPAAELMIAHDSETVSLSELSGIEVAAWSRRAPQKETSNEDAAAIVSVSHEAAVLAVADGCGGLRAGDQAAAMAVRTLAEQLQPGSLNGRIRPAILYAFEIANWKIVDLGIGAATTIAAVEFRTGFMRPYHVGDSMILVVGRNGKVKYVSIPHSPVGFAVASGLLDEAEAMHHDERHLVNNVLGDPSMRIELGPTIELARYDTVLIASDGLFDNLFEEEIADGIRKGTLKDGLESLIATARARMEAPSAETPSKPDDLTAIAFRQLESPSQ